MPDLKRAPAPRKEPMEMEPGDWFCAYVGHRLVSWIAQEQPVDCGGAVGWAVRALPLEDPEGRPWPDGLSRDVQWVPLAAVFQMLGPKIPGGVS